MKKTVLRLGWLFGGLIMALPSHGQSTPAEVVKVDKEQQKITLRHDAVPSLGLPAMAMAYRVQDPRWLDSLQAGTRLKFDAQKVNGQYVVIRLRAEPAR